jgi:hypothetical protein
MPRRSKTDVELGFLRSFWDVLKELEVEYGVQVTTTIYPTMRPGVCVYRLQGGQSPRIAGGVQGPHSIQFEFPNAVQMSLSCAMWGYANKLSDMYAEWDVRESAD